MMNEHDRDDGNEEGTTTTTSTTSSAQLRASPSPTTAFSNEEGEEFGRVDLVSTGVEESLHGLKKCLVEYNGTLAVMKIRPT